MIQTAFDYFVIIGMMRTGSNLLERSLQHFDDLVCYGELFNPDFVGFLEPEKALNISIKERDKNPDLIQNSLLSNSGGKIPGFRIFPDHNPTVLKTCLMDHKCAKIILRRNPLESFVSQQLALLTNQWRIGDLHTKVGGKIHFDPEMFEEYLERFHVFYSGVNRELQSAGQTAMQVEFDDLQNIESVNGIAKFIGSKSRIKKFKFRSSKQNSNALSEKIENYEEFTGYRNPILGLDRAQFDYLEPKTTPTTKKICLGANLEIAYLPTRNGKTDPIVDWLTAIDPKNKAPRTALSKAEVSEWFKHSGLKFVFADLEHPLDRAYDAFCNLFMFPDGKKYGGIRSTLTKRYGLELLPASYAGDKTRDAVEAAGYDLSVHRSNFKKFLRFLNASLQDQALYQPKPEFCSQSEQLAAYSEWAIPHFVALPHTRKAVFTGLALAMGLTNFPTPEVVKQHRLFEIDEIYDIKIEALVRKAYRRDYQNFGFMDYLISPK